MIERLFGLISSLHERGYSFSTELAGLRDAHPVGHSLQSITHLLTFGEAIRVLSQRKILEPVLKRERDSLLSDLFAADRLAAAHRFFHSGAPGTNAWLFAGFSRPPNTLTNLEFLDNLRARLLLPAVEMVRRCACRIGNSLGATIDPVRDEYHAISCGLNNGPRIHRHNETRDAICDFLSKVFPSAHVVKEPLVGTLATGGAVRADIRVSYAHWTKTIDVAFVNSAAASYRTSRAALSLHTATDVRERQKREHYIGLLGAEVGNSVTPFVIDATGHLGKSAQDLLDFWSGLEFGDASSNDVVKRARRSLVRGIALQAAKGLSFALQTWRKYAPLAVDSNPETLETED